ncbi:hypothetical protein [Limnoglobus roseus]|uniref:Uncharacterized protein n=1 Tax=Limnoglobus roseus TaxID=2598579 RepID=A0A5C1AMH6_9BACT|nr:hypothetical protein [Limnoglobus roseus]QEL20180.1 hypothetical protein PX52LOC_07268 [Limnoglobus roseus]
MSSRRRSDLCPLIVAILATMGPGCTLGPRTIEQGRLRYNEAVKATTEQQLLLNIVRLRYTDTPSSLSIANIADQQEIVSSLKAIPFFTSAGAGDLGSYRGSVLPQAEFSRAIRPTLSYTPIDDQEFTRRLFTPITLDGITYLAKTTWPVSTVFRLYLENLNWVSNAQSASGPTPRMPPDYGEFLNGVSALQRLSDRGQAVLYNQEQDEKLTDGVDAGDNTPTAAVEAAKAGMEYRRDDKGRWAVVKKKVHPLLRVGKVGDTDSDFATFCRTFKLDPKKRTFELTTEKLDPFLEGTPAAGLDTLDMETRSLLQVLFFVANGVTVPPCHATSGIAPQTVQADGTPFDWRPVFEGLFKVCWADGKKPPPFAHVAIRYQGYWFYIDKRDRDTMATFNLLVELSRLELGAKATTAPILTLPLGGP